MNKIPLTIKELKSNTEFNYDVFTKEALISTIVSVRDYFSDLEKENKKYKEVIDKVVKYIEKNMNQQLYTGKEMFRSYSPATDLLNILEEVK